MPSQLVRIRPTLALKKKSKFFTIQVQWLGIAIVFISMMYNIDVIKIVSSLPLVSTVSNRHFAQNYYHRNMKSQKGCDQWNDGFPRDLRVDHHSLCRSLHNERRSSIKTTLYDRSTGTEMGSTNSSSSSSSFYIRNALYSDLPQVANILIESFYNPSIIVRQYLYLSELSRLQGNFPYSAKDHSFFIACEKQQHSSNSQPGKEKIIGFVDVDARPGKKESDAPRPYLSDLAVLPSFRRRGVAQRLIKECEKEVELWNNDELYLRVERKNDGALKMYSRLGYEAMDHHYFGVKDTTILLRRGFTEIREKNKTGEEYNPESLVDYMI